jgi:predicted DNA-binding transcriptional regulator AlpA
MRSIESFVAQYADSVSMERNILSACRKFGYKYIEEVANLDTEALDDFVKRTSIYRREYIKAQILRFKEKSSFNVCGTQRTQIVMDYDDFMRVMDDVVAKIVSRLRESTPEPTGGDDQELMTAKEVAELFSVTNKTLWLWNKTGFLPRIRIGGVVRYRRADVEKAAQLKEID